MTLDLTRFPSRDLTAQAKIVSGDGTGPASYVTGGEVVSLQDDLGLSEVWVPLYTFATNGSAILGLVFDRTNSKLMWYDMAGAQVANATNLSGYTYSFLITGK